MSEKNSILASYPEYRVDIGIEVHVQLNTATKIFCPCSNAQTDKPNTYICPICCGHPGVLPVFNKQVLVNAIKAGLATNSQISEISSFARKHYFYPDLPKNYQADLVFLAIKRTELRIKSPAKEPKILSKGEMANMPALERIHPIGMLYSVTKRDIKKVVASVNIVITSAEKNIK